MICQIGCEKQCSITFLNIIITSIIMALLTAYIIYLKVLKPYFKNELKLETLKTTGVSDTQANPKKDLSPNSRFKKDGKSMTRK